MSDVAWYTLPLDVQEWLSDTYTREGISAWLGSYVTGDEAHKAHLIRLARTPSGGT